MCTGGAGNGGAQGATQGQQDAEAENNSRGVANAGAMGANGVGSNAGVSSLRDLQAMRAAQEQDSQTAADNASFGSVARSPTETHPSMYDMDTPAKPRGLLSAAERAYDDDNYAAAATFGLASQVSQLSPVGIFGAIGNMLGATHNANPDGSLGDGTGGNNGGVTEEQRALAIKSSREEAQKQQEKSLDDYNSALAQALKGTPRSAFAMGPSGFTRAERGVVYL
jgi:hypothetical protein